MNRFVSAGAVFLGAIMIIVGIVAVTPGDGSSPATAADGAFRVTEANGDIVEVDLVAQETTQQIAPDVDYQVWTFNGTTPGPVIRVQLGDTIRFTLTNDTSIGMQHSIDFHAALTPWSENYQPVDPGETLTFDWVAMYPGVFMYHCGVDPVLQHIGNGMYGAIIVESDDLLQEREFVLVASEFYPSMKPIDGVYVGDLDRMKAVDPEYVVFDGLANRYLDAPLQVRPDEPFRLWVVNAGPTLTNAFHVIGTLFPHVYPSGNWTSPLNGLQTWNIPPGDGAMFGLQIPDEGIYPFVTHAFAYTGLGSVGAIEVTAEAPPAPQTYPAMADPFSAGVLPFGDEPSTPASSPEPSPEPTIVPSAEPAGACAPAGDTVEVAAMDSVFDADCLAAPAGKPFEIVFDNMDAGIPHNVAIYTDESAETPLFVGETFNGPDVVTYEVPALEAGSYFFRCDVHPTTMTGTFEVA
jgi:nitrite reductase (NO-forming)